MPVRRLVASMITLAMTLAPRAAAADQDKVPATEKPKPKRVATLEPASEEIKECFKVPGARRVRVTLKSPTELRDLVGWISSMTCKRLVVPTALQAQPVSFISPTPLTPAEAYRGFLSALEVMGLTVVPSGAFLKVVQSNWAVQSPVRTLGDGERDKLGDSDEVVTQLVRLREVRVDQLTPVLQKLKSRAGDISSFGPGNLLIITDHAANVRRMLKLVSELDLPAGGAEIWVVLPQHADPTELAKLLGDIFSPGGGAGPTPALRESAEAAPASPQQPAVRFLAHLASGALIVIGSEPAFRRVQSLLKVLDSEQEASQPQTWTYRLKHGLAEPLSAAVNNLVGSGGGGRTSAKNSPTTTSSPFEGQVRVNAEASSNTLLIMATPRDYLQVRRVIEELDRPRRQIFVEAYILEMQLDRTRDVGVAAHTGAAPGGNSMLVGTSFGAGFNSIKPDATLLTGLALGVQGPVVAGASKLLGVDLPSFGIVLQALQTDSNFNLLSSPTLLATENEEAEIQVGENIPVRGASTVSSLGNQAQSNQLSLLGALTNQVDRRNVGIGLKLTPTVSGDDRIRLKLRQEVSAVAKEDFGGLGASTSQRLITSVITLRDQQTVVIGGLITEEQTLTQSKVPLLGDIPLLGYLFRREGKKLNRKNLLLVLTPYLIRDESDLRRIYQRKLEERRTFLRRYSQLRGGGPTVEIDFRYKRGLLGEIERAGREIDAEARLAAEAKRGPASRPSVTPVP